MLDFVEYLVRLFEDLLFPKRRGGRDERDY